MLSLPHKSPQVAEGFTMKRPRNPDCKRIAMTEELLGWRPSLLVARSY